MSRLNNGANKTPIFNNARKSGQSFNKSIEMPRSSYNDSKLNVDAKL